MKLGFASGQKHNHEPALLPLEEIRASDLPDLATCALGVLHLDWSAEAHLDAVVIIGGGGQGVRPKLALG